jgi:PAT family beta-lactamase induction signal transducer AmpG
MNTPFLKRELGLTNEQYAWVSGLLGALGAILGAIWGGKWIKRTGLRKAIWPLTLLMNLNIIWYILLAVERPDPTHALGIGSIALVHFLEQIAAGLGSAALLVFLLGTCKPEFKAAHYAIGSAIMSLPATVVGGLGGHIVERIGYTGLFTVSLIASLPTFALLPFIPISEGARRDERQEAQ